ncbi:MAG: 4Fe-4S dicluster domain-containing protein [Thermodesulfobacteriota bacterium]
MQWTKEAEEAVSKVPFFVRRRVRKRVEEEATNAGAKVVSMGHVNTCRQRYLTNMEEEVKGFQVEACFGSSGCPNRAQHTEELVRKLELLLESQELRAFLKERVQGPLKLHHEFRVCVSDCPNACSRPQIADLGLIGALRPDVSESPCSLCGSCVETCRERAVKLDHEREQPVVDYDKCVSCGQCVEACPTGTLVKGVQGFRIQIGGKLGRHPRLASELPDIHSTKRTLEIAEQCLDYYKQQNSRGERFGEMLERTAWNPLGKAPADSIRRQCEHSAQAKTE